MNIIPGEVIIDAPRTPPPGKSQPIEAIGNLEVPLDDAQVREAIAKAEASNQDPQTLQVSELATPPIPNPLPEISKPAVEVPEKFLKPDGAVDVDKIQASNKALVEAIQKKEEALSRTVEDYMREYNENQKKFSGLPNAERVIAQAPQVAPAPPLAEGSFTPQQFEEIVRKDYEADPLATTTRLFNLMIENKFRPIEEREKMESTRGNLQKLAEKDPRILREDVFAAVNAKLDSDPSFWKLKNPHKAAYLEVKDEMRLGDPVPNGAGQALPSRSSPVLGGGTPPSAPSSSVPSQNVIGSLHTLDLRDKKQEEMGDEAIRSLLAANRG